MHKTDSPNTANSLSRRQALKFLGTGALLIAADPILGGVARAAKQSASGPSSQLPAPTPTVQAFGLTDVRLLKGPFLDAQQRDEAYLLKLEADRMLHNFRVNAGLEPKAPVYGGWESVQTWADIRCHGHTLSGRTEAAPPGTIPVFPGANVV